MTIIRDVPTMAKLTEQEVAKSQGNLAGFPEQRPKEVSQGQPRNLSEAVGGAPRGAVRPSAQAGCEVSRVYRLD